MMSMTQAGRYPARRAHPELERRRPEAEVLPELALEVAQVRRRQCRLANSVNVGGSVAPWVA